jgi:hypothetical protein
MEPSSNRTSHVFKPLFAVLLLLGAIASTSGANAETETKAAVKNETLRYPIAVFDFQRVELPYVICLWILIASLAKIGKFTDLSDLSTGCVSGQCT